MKNEISPLRPLPAAFVQRLSKVMAAYDSFGRNDQLAIAYALFQAALARDISDAIIPWPPRLRESEADAA